MTKNLIAALLATAALPGVAHAQTNPSPFTTGTRYDADGRVTGAISPDPDGAGPRHHAAVRNSYDAAGRLIRVEKGELAGWQSQDVPPSQWSGFGLIEQVETSYDLLGRKLTEKTSGFDASHTLTAYTLIHYSYDAAGQPECTAERMNPAAFASLPASACTPGIEGTQGPDRITRNVYDAAGQLLQVRQAVGTTLEQGHVSYAYTPNGKRSDVIDANGNRAHLTYDAFDRVAQWQFPSATIVTGFDDSTPASAMASAGSVNTADHEEYGYDPNGNRTSWRKRDGRAFGFTYDALNRMTVKTVPDGCPSIGTGACPVAAATRDVYYAYDLRGLQLSARFDSATGEGVSNSYDGFGELTASTSDMGGTARTLGYLYDADGGRTRITHPDGVYVAMDHDGLDRMGAAQWWAPTIGTVPFLSIAYDALGRRTTTVRASSSTGYSYDGNSRLAGMTQTFAGNAGTVTTGFGYNPAGQVTSETRDNDAFAYTGTVNATRAYAVNGLNQYTAVGAASPTYDANGNLTSDGATTYAYDAENRLIGTGGGVTLAYDPLGRLSRTGGGAFGASRLLYDGDAMVAEYDDDTGAMRRRFVFGPGADEPVLWDEGAAMNCTATRFLHTDHQGSIVAAADCYGNRTSINSYDEYGTPAAGNVGRFGYTGQAWLPELGLWHYKARVYSPKLGRFLQTDPVGYDDQVNLYAYVGNDPVNAVDHSGKRIELIGTRQEIARLRADISAVARSDPRLQQRFDVLRDSKAVSSIRFARGDEASYNHPTIPVEARNGKGSDSQSVIEKNGAADDSHPGARGFSERDIVAHELFGHGYDNARGHLDQSTNPKNGILRSEESAVRAENAYRVGVGEPVRTQYGPATVEKPKDLQP